MGLLDWFILVMTETAKYFLFTYGILGFQVREGKKKYLCFLYIMAGSLWSCYFDCEGLLFQTTWGAVILFVFFDGTVKKKLQTVLLEYSAISAVDMMAGSIVCLVCRQEAAQEMSAITHIANVIGVICWVIGCVFLYRDRREIQKGLKQLEGRYFFVIELLLLGFVLMAANTQASVSGELTEEMRDVSFIISMFSTILIMVVCVILMRTVYLNRQFRSANEYQEKCLAYQRDYYEKLIVKDEEIRKFRHDVRKHLHVLSMLCRKGNIDEAGRYVDELDGRVEEMTGIVTGNAIADYFVNEAVYQLEQSGEIVYNVVGRFPDEMRISNMDLCVLLGNALDNAREALLKVEGRRELRMEILNLRQVLMIRISNSACKPERPFLESTKEKKREHGYGTKNMMWVVEKYDGDIKWYYRDGFFVVEIEI